MFSRVHVSGGLHVMGCECSEVVHVAYMHVSGGLAYMSWDVNVQ